MMKIKIKPFNVIDNTNLPELNLDELPVSGDPVEIAEEMYYVCDIGSSGDATEPRIGLIPLVVRNPGSVTNIGEYLECLSKAHRRIQFRKKNNICDFNDCDEMIIG